MAKVRHREPGIYQILCIPSGHSYIGSSVNITRRWGDHRCALRWEHHANQPLSRAWAKYGEEAFVFRVLERVSDVGQLIPREQHYIDTLQPEYNARPLAGNQLGFHHRADSIQRMRERARLQRRHPTDTQQAYYDRLRTMAHSPAKRAWYARQRGLHKHQPLTAPQIAALDRGRASRPLTSKNMAAWTANIQRGQERRRGAVNTPLHRAHISESCKKAFASFSPEKQEALRNQARLNALTHAQRRHEAGLINQQLVWDALVKRGWVPSVPGSSLSAAHVVREDVPHLSQARIADYIRMWEDEGKIAIQYRRHLRRRPTPPAQESAS